MFDSMIHSTKNKNMTMAIFEVIRFKRMLKDFDIIVMVVTFFAISVVEISCGMKMCCCDVKIYENMIVDYDCILRKHYFLQSSNVLQYATVILY